MNIILTAVILLAIAAYWALNIFLTYKEIKVTPFYDKQAHREAARSAHIDMTVITIMFLAYLAITQGLIDFNFSLVV